MQKLHISELPDYSEAEDKRKTKREHIEWVAGKMEYISGFAIGFDWV